MSLVPSLLLGFYALLPPAMLAFAVRRLRRYGQARPLASFSLNVIWGSVLGVAVVMLNGWVLGGQFGMGQVVGFAYFATAGLCLLRGLDWITASGVARLMKVDVVGKSRRPLVLCGLLLQRAFMVACVVVFAFAALVAYRPRVTDDRTPTLARLPYVDERFRSDDGVRLAGWFLPTVAGDAGSSTTILICHGVSSRRQMQLDLARTLVAAGYNVMVFDFRAHGESGGNAFSYGDRERLDVLAAVRQLKQQHPQSARRIIAIGINTGAAAVIGAAVDPQSGASIDALVLVEPFADFGALADEAARACLPAGVRELVRYVSVPLAGWHAGSSLASFSPVANAEALWPRPVLVVHGRGQTFVPTGQEMDLARQLPGAYAEYWPADNYVKSVSAARRATGVLELSRLALIDWLGLRDPVTSDPGVLGRILEFIQQARPMPVI